MTALTDQPIVVPAVEPTVDVPNPKMPITFNVRLCPFALFGAAVAALVGPSARDFVADLDRFEAGEKPSPGELAVAFGRTVSSDSLELHLKQPAIAITLHGGNLKLTLHNESLVRDEHPWSVSIEGQHAAVATLAYRSDVLFALGKAGIWPGKDGMTTLANALPYIYESCHRERVRQQCG